jgi:hypothetical protein
VPGQQFALTEAAYALARLMQHVESIERQDVENVGEASGLGYQGLQGRQGCTQDGREELRAGSEGVRMQRRQLS